MTQTVQCPSCGGEIELRHRNVKVATCAYCDTVVAIERDGVDATGKTARLADFMSAFATGKNGSVADRDFYVMGRLRYEYADGYWDEWYLLFEDGTDGWVEEDEGELTLVQQQPVAGPVPQPEDVRPGTRVSAAGREIYVVERGRATIAGMEGQLPRGTRIGQTIGYIDGTSDGQAVMIEFTENEVELFIGREVDFDDIELH